MRREKMVLLVAGATLTVALAGELASRAKQPRQQEPGSGEAVAKTAKPDYLHPLIKDSGRVVTPRGTVLQPITGMKAVFDVTGHADPAQVVKGLDRAALNLNLAKAAGVAPRQVQLAVVLHGDATRAALDHEGYARATAQRQNPSAPLIRDLRQHGVEVYVCLQALAHRNLAATDVMPEVKVASSAAMALIRKQQEGYAYLPFD